MAKIFFIEDNKAIREAVTSYLVIENHEVVEFDKMAGVPEALTVQNPDLVILDVMLPDGNGFKLAREIRMKSDIPVIFLTAKTSETDRITGFEVGGDDYIIKPFSPRELVLRVRVILKRKAGEKGKSENNMSWELNGKRLTIDILSHKVSIEGKEVLLTQAEWEILVYLASHAGIVISREILLGESLKYMTNSSVRTIDTHIKNLRVKLGKPGWIETARSYGYRFAGDRKK
ncbi:MAG: response regulator transcription factor [Spirochaetales bacterium]|nr:response regulator transcription factor [Spirochaetales bacterium]